MWSYVDVGSSTADGMSLIVMVLNFQGHVRSSECFTFAEGQIMLVLKCTITQKHLVKFLLYYYTRKTKLFFDQKENTFIEKQCQLPIPQHRALKIVGILKATKLL